MGGRYRLVSRIAVGGMGEVWVAHDDSLARDVAVKVLREEFAGDAGFLERFRTEARNSAGLSHPNIASLYDYGEQDGSGFLVMELVLGEPMSDLLDRQPVLPTRRLLPILAQTARALHAAHVGGVVHRDVKPGNILLARSGQVKITDFGISMAVNQVPMTASGMVMGTAQYLSPEQAIGKAATPASDVYSLGIVAYEALVGNRPFTGPTAVDIAVAHVNTPVPPLPADIDAELADLVMRMLAKDPEQRPRSAASLARQLDDLLDGTPPGGVPVAGGRHTRFVDVVDAVETGSLPVPARPEAAPAAARGGASPAGGATATAPATGAGAQPAGPGTWTPEPRGPEAPATPSALPVLAPDGAVAVPGRQERPPGAPETEAHPPVYAPATPTRAELRAARSHRTTLRTSTTTGLRWGQFSRPLLALILMVVFALLGAAFADRVLGPSRAEDDGTSRSQVSASGAGAGTSGMITTHARDGASPYPQTTTAKDL